MAEPPQRPVGEVLEIKENGSQTTGAAENLNAGAPKAPRPFDHIGIKIAGFGGQGVLLLGQLLAEMGMREHLEVS